MPGFRRTSLVTALAAVLCITASTAEAIKFEMLDADGGVVGEYAPLTDWVTAPGSASGDVSALNGGVTGSTSTAAASACRRTEPRGRPSMARASCCLLPNTVTG